MTTDRELESIIELLSRVRERETSNVVSKSLVNVSGAKSESHKRAFEDKERGAFYLPGKQGGRPLSS